MPLIAYVRGIFIKYGDIWNESSVMQKNPLIEVRTKPHLVIGIADLELLLLSKRYEWASESELDGLRDVFIKDTCCGLLLTESKYEQ
jgi:hypothetical protein